MRFRDMWSRRRYRRRRDTILYIFAYIWVGVCWLLFGWWRKA